MSELSCSQDGLHVVGGGSKELGHEVGRWALFTYFKDSVFVDVLGFHYVNCWLHLNWKVTIYAGPERHLHFKLSLLLQAISFSDKR